MKVKDKIDRAMSEVKVDAELGEKLLEQMRAGKNAPYKKNRPMGKVVAAASLSLLFMGSVTVMASGLSNVWIEQVAKMFGAKQELQEQLATDGYAHNLTIETKGQATREADEVLSATCNGLTVTATQTLADKYGMYVYLDVKSEEGVELDEQIFKGWDIWIDGEDRHYGNMNAGMVSDKYAVSRTQRGYEIWMFNDKELDVSGKTIRIRLTDLMNDRTKLDEYVQVEGVWELQWQVKGSMKSKSIHLEGIGELEVTPLSYRIAYHKKRDMSDDLSDNFLNISFVLEDGTVYKTVGAEDEVITGGPGSLSSKGESCSFDKVLDTDHLEKVIVEGNTYLVE